MSKIDKLNITGIRSFNAQRGETIQFYTPLTLIVGINGSGKTTIVECLKYVTTGLLPPGAKVGGAFIHDPKLLGEKEVMAQVKLQFKAVTGARMVVTRSSQLTVKKTTRTQKTLEGSLLMEKNGEKTTVSSRVAELDSILPQYLGVTQAVLDNVIFCHQEESTWPLSEPSNLKKKFDEIFEAQKYIKAIDNIKQIRKKHLEELGKYKIMEQNAKEDRDRAEKAKKKSVQLSDEIEDLRTRCKDLERKMEEARDAADQAWKQSESYARILGALEGKRIEVNSLQKGIEDIRAHLKEASESDEWLEYTLQQFTATMETYEEEQQTKAEQYSDQRKEIKELQDQLSRKKEEKGKHEQDREAYQRQLDRRRTMIKEAATKHQMRGYDDLSNEALVEDFLRKIQKTSKDQDGALTRARKQADAERQEARSAINRLTERQAALQDNKNSIKDEIRPNDQELNQYQRKVNEINVDEGHRAVIESKIENISNTIRDNNSAALSADWDTKLKDANQGLRTQEDEITRLNTELYNGTKRAGEVAKLAHLNQERKEREQSLQTLMNAHADRLEKLLGETITAASIETSFQKMLDQTSRNLTAAERERDAVAREIEQVQFKQKSIRDDINAKTSQVQKFAKAVEQVIGRDISEYDDALGEAQSQVDFARDEAKGIGGLGDYFNKILATAKENHMCRVCQRPFKGGANDHGLKQFQSRMENLIKKAARDSEEVDLMAADKYYKQVLDAGIARSNWNKLLQDEIPSLEKGLQGLNQQRESLVKSIEKHDKVVEQRQSARRDLEAVSRTVSSIAKCDTEIQTFNGQIEELTSKQSQQGNIRTLEDIQEEIKRVNENIGGTKKYIAKLTSDRDASRNQLHQFQLEHLDLKNKLNTANAELERKAVLIARVEEFRNTIQRKRDAIDKIDKDIQKIEPELSTAKARSEEVSHRWESQIADLARDSNQLVDTINGLKWLNEQIKSYVDRGGLNQLTSVMHDIETFNAEIERAESAQVQLTREINKIAEQLRDSQVTKRHYEDNLRYRRKTSELEQLRDEIVELSSRNAEVDRNRFQEESKYYTDQCHKYSATREGCLGEMKTKDGQLAELLKDYNTDFKDAPRRYKEARVKVETTKAAVEDLARYGGALDKAIMKFHTIKMGQINEIIEELWQKTYQGTDVDGIMIRSDAEDGSVGGSARATASTTSSTRRQYNYRVTMSKQGVEMDMRGRCSAGQKVLACIIIRLALAEVFSVNCGLIALDEPTTNLDRDNIQALAVSLHDIIKTRQQQSNFQLIVITHDEDFLRHMDCGEFTDYYYRVSRDGAGDSIIERQDILEVDR